MNTSTCFRPILIVLSIFMLSNVVLAQRDQGPPPIPSGEQVSQLVQELAKELSLSDSQTTKVKALYQSHFQEVSEMMKQQQRPSRQEMETLRSNFETMIKAVLTPEQAQEYDAFQKRHSPQPNQRRPRR